MVWRLIERWLGAFPLGHKVIAYVSSQGVPAYMVGGTVRDALLRRQTTDLDIAVESGAMSMARRVADRIGGAYVPLDLGRDVARVVVRVGGEQYHFDFAGLRAQEIEGDLRARDYTVNAMAVRLGTGPSGLIDPAEGRADLDARVLRVTGKDVFKDDPLRILRGLRLSGELGFTLTSDSESLAREHLGELRRVSAERVRDELARVLSLDNSADTLAYASALGALPVILPEFRDGGALLRRSIGVVSRLEELLGQWTRRASAVEVAPKAAVESELGRYRGLLAWHWGEELSVGRPRWLALKLAALLSPVPHGPAVACAVARRLRFSTQEVRFVSAAIQAANQCLEWAGKVEPERVQIYRHYRRLGSAGMDGAILSLAAYAPATENREIGDTWTRLLRCVRRLLGAWFDERDALVDPPRLLSGRDLVRAFALAPGRQVGQLLEMLREAQVEELVRTRDQAIEFVRARVAGSQKDAQGPHSQG